MRPQAVRVREILHGERMLWQAGEAVEVNAGTERDDQLIIAKVDRAALGALHNGDLLLGEVDAHHLGLAYLNAAKQLTQGHDGVGGMDAGGRDLGQERLENEIIVRVDQLDIELATALPLKRLGRENAAEAAADHQDFLLFHGLPRLVCC